MILVLSSEVGYELKICKKRYVTKWGGVQDFVLNVTINYKGGGRVIFSYFLRYVI